MQHPQPPAPSGRPARTSQRRLFAFGAVLAVAVAVAWACSTDAEDVVDPRPEVPSPLVGATVQEDIEPAGTVEAERRHEVAALVPRTGIAGVPDDSTQAIVVTADHWRSYQGSLSRFERDGVAGPWSLVSDAPTDVVLGRRGLGWGRGLHAEGLPGPLKQEGDHRSPAGVFDLGEARGYARVPPPSTTWPFQHSGTQWRCMDDPRSEAYNTFISTNGMPLPPSAGIARREQVFDLMLFVMHNTSPVLRRAGSCVFLHVWAKQGQPTQGCVAMAPESMRALLPWLQLERHPVLVQMPRDVLLQYAQAWRLPVAH